MPINLSQPEPPALETLKLEVGDTWVGTIVDIDEVPHLRFGTDQPELDRRGVPKTKWVMRLRPDGATSGDTDVKFWAQNQIKFALAEALRQHPNNYRGGRIKVERLPDGEPRNPGWRGPANYRFTIKPGPDGWEDPYGDTAAVDDDFDAPF